MCEGELRTRQLRGQHVRRIGEPGTRHKVRSVKCAIGLKESMRERGIRRVRDDDGEDSTMGRNYVRTA